MGIKRTNPRIRIWIIPTFIFLFLGIQQADAHGSEQGVACFMAVTGLGMSTIWTMDMIKADKIDVSKGYLFAKELGSDSYLLPHWIAEYSTAGLLIAGGYGLYKDEPWARDVSLLALGALNYTAMNSLGWSLGKRDRLVYAIPMILSLTGSTISISIIL